jgi:hypothetical protein
MEAAARAALKEVARDLNALERAERKVALMNERLGRSAKRFMCEARMVGLSREHLTRIVATAQGHKTNNHSKTGDK